LITSSPARSTAPEADDRGGTSAQAASLGAPSVLLVTGAYYPEISAAGVQCRAMAKALAGRVRFGVLTTAVDPALPAVDRVGNVDVFRVSIDVQKRSSKLFAAPRLLARLLRAIRGYHIVHLHGFSQKNVMVSAVAKALGRRMVLTLHTAGQDEPDVIRRAGPLAYWSFTAADLVTSVTPRLTDAYLAAGLAPDRLRPISNGVDLQRFRPADEQRRTAIRRSVGLPLGRPLVVFVGFFSRDKRPDLLFRAWRRMRDDYGTDASLVFVGATERSYYEIDNALVAELRSAAAREGDASRVMFVPPTNDIEQYFQTADTFVLPSAREANPLALLEAMACGVPSIASRLPGATDVIIEDGVNGRLVAVDDEKVLASAMNDILTDRAGSRLMGDRARQTVAARFDADRIADEWLAAYRHVLSV
jgi:glycosyltransferase involved in cell wall biosynthesis